MNDNGDIDLDMVSEFVPSKYLSASLTSLNTCIGKTKGKKEEALFNNLNQR